MTLRRLTDDDLLASRRLSRLAFGGPREVSTDPPRGDVLAYGAFDDAGELEAKVVALDYQQWWGGRPVPMVGIGGVATRPDARGRGLVRALLDLVAAEASAPVSVLFPTSTGIYRRLGWEVVGTLDTTPVLPLHLTRRRKTGVRRATAEDLPAIQDLYDARGRTGSGLLTRTGPMFADGTAGVLEHDVVDLAVEDGEVTGYVAYDREGGYRGGGHLDVSECVARTDDAFDTVLATLGEWAGVVDEVRWRGDTAQLQRHLGANLAPPRERQPWMLRVLDPVAAFAGRGYARDGQADFTLEGRPWRLEVSGGEGQLVDGAGGPPVTVQQLARAWAGLHVAEAPALSALLAGPAPEILDYF